MSTKTFLDRFNKNKEEKESLVEEFEELYTKIFGNFIYNNNEYIGHEDYFESINNINEILIDADIYINLEVTKPSYCEDLPILLPHDFFDNYDKYLEDKNKQIEKNKESEKQNKISQIKDEIYKKSEELYNLTENCYCGDIQTLLEDI